MMMGFCSAIVAASGKSRTAAARND